MTTSTIIPRKRLKNIPSHLRLNHEYCYFLHDETVRLLVEYEENEAATVKFKFPDKTVAKRFHEIAAADGSISALRQVGLEDKARKIILNQITMALTSDALHHIYEALSCFERRKTVVGLNLLRKPFMDNLTYLAWMISNEDAFYQQFSKGEPDLLAQNKLGNIRRQIISESLAKLEISDVLKDDFIFQAIFDRNSDWGLYRFFQHAVHLITQLPEIKTSAENFNFVFKSSSDDDQYEVIYYSLPHILLYFSHIANAAFERIRKMDRGARNAFHYRSISGLYIVEGGENELHARNMLADKFSNLKNCPNCDSDLVFTRHNAARALFAESHRCVKCQTIRDIPFAWLI